MFIVMIFHNITVLTEFLFRLTQPWRAKEISFKNCFLYTNPKIWTVAYFIESMWTEKLNHKCNNPAKSVMILCAMFSIKAGEIMHLQIRMF